MSTYAYLVSDGEHIRVTLEKPAQVTIEGNTWFEIQTSCIGECISTFTDSVWVGTLGVYDIEKIDHTLKLAKDTHDHTLSLALRRLDGFVTRQASSEALHEVRHYMWCMDGRQQQMHRWSPQAKALWDLMQGLRGICRTRH